MSASATIAARSGHGTPNTAVLGERMSEHQIPPSPHPLLRLPSPAAAGASLGRVRYCILGREESNYPYKLTIPYVYILVLTIPKG
jgi:hypothetical protein